jgi:predicted nuclease with TOPRIM domain
MADTEVRFSIKLDGSDSIANLTRAINETKLAMKGLSTNTEEYAEKAQKLGRLDAELKGIKKRQDDINKSFLETSSALGSYDQLSSKLNKLRKDYKDLAVAEQENSEEAKALLNEITALDEKLKKVDATVGQFQRNVGNYPKPDYSDIISNLNKLQNEYNQLSEEQKQNSAEAKELANQIDRLNKEVVDITSSYDKLSAENNKLKKRYKDLAVQNKLNTDEAKALKKQIDELDNTLKKTDKTVDNSTKKVGEFPKVFNLAGRGLRRYAGVLEDSQGKLSGFSIAVIGAFAAFKAASAIVKVIGDLNAFNKELDRTEQQLKALTGITGDDLGDLQTNITALSKTFDVDSKTIIDSAKQISEKTGVSFGEAIGQIENGLLKGSESADTFLSGIAEFPEAYSDASQASGEFANKQKDLLEVNRDLADSQAEGARKFEEVGSVIEKLGGQAKSFLIDTFLFLYNNVLTPLYDNTIKPLITAFEDLTSNIGGGGVVLQGLTKIINFSLLPLRSFLKALTLIVNGFTEIIKYGRQAGEFFGVLSKQTDVATKSSVNYFAETTKGITETFKLAEEYEAQRTKQEQDAINARKKQAEATKQANEEAKRQAEQLSKDRQKFIDEENKYIEAALKVNQSIIDKTNKLTTELLTDEYNKRRKLAQENYTSEVNAIQENLDEQKKANLERIKEAERLYFANSVEANKAREEAKANEIAGAEELANLEILLKQKLTDELLAIDKDQTNKLIEENKKLFDQRKNEIQNSYTNELNILDTFLEEGLIKEEEYDKKVYELNKKRIEDQLALNKNQLDNNKDLNTQEIDTIVSSNIALNKDLAKLESDRTKNAKTESEKRIKIEQEEVDKKWADLNDKIQLAGKFTQIALETVSGFLEASDQKRMERLEKDAEANQQIQDNLNERLQTATGLERRYLEQQLEASIKNAETIAKQKQKLEKDAAKRKKATAVIESIINTALAVSSALATPPAPNVIAGVIAGIAGAAQTAVIAAQPLAKGGVVGKGDDIVQFANGGRVTSRGNIKPLSNGDNVLATLKTGEIVLNESQQRRIGYASLKRAQIPNFANGGLVGAPTSLISNANNTIASEQMRVNLMDEMVKATNQRIDRLTVVYTATTDFEVEKGRNDKKTIKANSTF